MKKLWHVAFSSSQFQIYALTPASQADIANRSQISCSMDPEVSGLSALSSRWLLPVGQKQHGNLPTPKAVGKDSLVHQGRPGLKGFRGPDRLQLVLEARERDQQRERESTPGQAPTLDVQAVLGSNPSKRVLLHCPSCPTRNGSPGRGKVGSWKACEGCGGSSSLAGPAPRRPGRDLGAAWAPETFVLSLKISGSCIMGLPQGPLSRREGFQE